MPMPTLPRRTPRWHMYRCPVCGHADEVDLDAGEPAPVSCSHCEADLEVVARSAEEAAAAVKVARRRRAR
jgi:transcription elongation factor Elf1